ncbi:hypothetical protein TCAL_15547 [Tigriopus californicus]|uniref:Ionotropic glutamate receptor L-glutamate and glycine-binding domain-containing protein n=1 Tax=Tigriopus californicus TaxID=6832 RepID=A0A553PTA4_TIGCA|nr:glutamate receptor 1-like [Tigriopus californicus]TRY80912.1 hypothetical protein TCAL_15547 [Tigriopus californicus]
MSGQHFNVSGVGLSPPNAVFNNRGEIVGGVSLDVFNIMANAMQFNYTFRTENSWGGRIPNSKQWNGLIGSVRNQTSTIGVGLVFVDYNYYQAVDYLDPLWFYPVGLRSKKPSVLPGYGNLVRPFSSSVWIVIVMGVIFLMVVIVGIKYFEDGSNGQDLAHHGFLVVRILFSQSGNLSAHNRRSSKIFVGFWVMAVLFLSSMYECNLRAYLMLQSYEKPIETEQDIVDRGLDLYLGYGTPFLAYFRESQMEIRRQFWTKAQTNPDLIYQPAIADCLLEHEKTHLLEKNGVDLLSPAFFLGRYPIMKANFGYEPFSLSKRAMFEFQFSFVLGKYQDFREDLNQIVRHLHASGILNTLPSRYFSLEALVGEITDTTPKPFGMEHFVAAFAILGVGLIGSAMALAKERCGSK